MPSCINILMLFMLLMSPCVMAQETNLSEAEIDNFKAKVIKKSEELSSILSDFEQVKHLDFLTNDVISKGKLSYKNPRMIKWSYTQPFHYTAIFNGDRLMINDNGNQSEFNLGGSKSFKSLNDLVVKSVRGDMFDEQMFKIHYSKSAQGYQVKFIPLEKSLNKMIAEMIITFDSVSLYVVQLKMIEANNDYTLLKFTNQQFNVPIPDSVFDH